jgi:hypothetical protein
MNRTIFLLLFGFIVSFSSCNKDTTPVTTTSTPPTPVTGWQTAYEEKTYGTFSCNMPNLCWYDIITDSLDFRNCDSIRILLYYRSYHNTALSVSKYPYYAELFNFAFPDSTTGVIDRYFSTDYNMKIILDFSFEVENKFTIDTLKVFRKIKAQ